MVEFLFNDGAVWFGVPALLGSFVFGVKMILLLIGADADADLDFDADIDVDDSTEAFRVFSLQAVAAFLMGFGWIALLAYRVEEMSLAMSTLVGVAAGLGLMWLLLWLLRVVYSMQASGNIPIESASGTTGTVYVGVPAEGAGKGEVRLVIDGRQRMFRAVTDGEELTRDTPIRVVRVNSDHTVLVERA